MEEIQSLSVPVRVLILAEGEHQAAQFGEKSVICCGGEPGLAVRSGCGF